MQKTFKNMRVVVDHKGNPFPDSCKKSRKNSQEAFIKSQNKGRWVWAFYSEKGYTCVQVNVSFEIVNDKKETK